MQDFNTSRFIHHTKEYLKAVTRRTLYSSTDAGMKVAGNLLALLIVVSILPFMMLLLLIAGVCGINAWLELGWGWSFLIGAGVLLLLVVCLLLLRKAIVRAFCSFTYRRIHPTLTKIEDKLRPEPDPSGEQDERAIIPSTEDPLS